MKVAILGNGQLGAMLQQAGQRIGIEVSLLEITGDQIPDQQTLISAEREHWPVNAFTSALEQHGNWLNGPAFAALTNRLRQKKFLDTLGLACAPWVELSATTTQAQLHLQLGPEVFLKRASGGYDGYGQKRLHQDSPQDLAQWNSDVVAEQAIAFEREVSIIGARNRHGHMVFYRLTENRHTDGILRVSLSQPDTDAQLQSQAEQMLSTVMQTLEYVGVMAMECFVVNGKLLINEIAPRVHNSGHWTQAGASISQFELHLRAICGLHLPQPEQTGFSVMINLIGLEYDPDWLSQGAAQLHWYGKQWRAGRKMGHLNFTHPNPQQLIDSLSELKMPGQYLTDCQWAMVKLAR